MRYVLDTNIVSYWMRGNESTVKKISEKKPCDLAISLITYAEILYGIKKSARKKHERMEKLKNIVSLIRIIPMDIEAAEHYAHIRVFLEKNGTIISERDLQIASIARSKGLCLATHNHREFDRFPDLEVEDWG